MKYIVSALVLIVTLSVSAQANAFQLRHHEVTLTESETLSIPVKNTQDHPIVLRITPPEGVQVFPRRARLLPGDRQVIKVRMISGHIEPGARLAFSYAVDRPEKTGSHARLTLRIPVREVEK
ncbi:hypothetical protein B9Q17_08165 [Marinobacter vinifirmus]|uniref:Uncharacterized protein n=1 Tax=Marinobacter vinifirmus TaxID=355591 RepID=A0A7Z1ING6_9GAMM|nr:hypothetical protein [Marinobacter vinifirmus]OZC36747.1 hypothetical protein B9Q17_08165 [Marinobacter vinifirmus]